MKLTKLIILLISLLIFSPSFFGEEITGSDQPSIIVDVITQPDISPDRYYISQNIVRQIELFVNSDYLSKEPYKNPKVKYTLSVYPESEVTKGTYFKISKDEEEFLSEINSEVGVDIIARNFTENIIKIKVIADLYDEYNNLIASGSKSITLITNNSIDDFTYTPQRDEPEFSGVVYSRDVSYIINKEDYDTIKIKSYSDFNYVYDIRCDSDNYGLITKTMYEGNNIFDLNISVDLSRELKKGVYQINCYAYNKDNKFDLKVIKLNYLNEPIIVGTGASSIIDSNTQSKAKPGSAFKNKLLKFRASVRNGTFSVLRGIRNFLS